MKSIICAAVISAFLFSGVSYAGSYDITTGTSHMPSKIVKEHIVQHGEELHLLSAYYQLNPREWRDIYDRNDYQIKNPNLIYPKQKFKVNVYEDWTPPYNLDQWLKDNPRW